MAAFTAAQKAAYSRGEIDRFGNPINGAGGQQGTINPASIITATNQNAINQNNGIVGGLQGQPQRVDAAAQYANAYDQYAINQQQGLAGQTSGTLAGNSALGFQNAGQTNAQGQNLLGALGGIYGGINASNQASYGQYQQAIAPYQAPVANVNYNAISGDPYGSGLQNQALSNFSGMMGGSMDISAAQVGSVAQAQAAMAQAQMYYSSQQDIARQNQSYDQLYGAGTGSLDYTAAQYGSNIADQQRQFDAYNNLEATGMGALDFRSKAAEAYSDPATRDAGARIFGKLEDASNGSLDVQSQAAQARVSDATLANQKQGMDKLWGLTDPSITPQERLISEEARRNQEQQNRASRGAVMADLSSRGFSGSGAQMTDMLGAQEQTGQERTLADLGAQANASARSTSALGMYVDASGKIRSQEFDEAFSRAAAGDQMAVANVNRRLQATGMAADQVNFMRSASFDEAYKRGLAADQASAQNQQTRLSGQGMAANQANAIRAAEDNVGMFNTGQTNNAYANNQQTRLSGMGMAAQQSNAIRSANDTVGMGNADRQTGVNIANANNLTSTSQFNAGQTNTVNMFNTGEQNRVGIANQGVRAQGAISYGQEANAIRTANDVIAMHNSTQQVIVDQGNQTARIADDRRLTDLAATSQGIQQGINKDYATNMTSLGDGYLRENDAAGNRNQVAIDASSRNALANYGVGMDLVGAYGAYGQNVYNRSLGTAQVSNQIGQTSIQNNLNNAALSNEGPKLQMGQAAYDQAALALKADPGNNLLNKLSFGIL